MNSQREDLHENRYRELVMPRLTPRASLARARKRARERFTPELLRRLGLIAVALTILGLSLIGLFSLTRGTPVERLRRDGANGLAAVGDPLFTRTMEVYTGTPLLSGNAVEVLVNGDGTYPALWRDLEGAERTITIQMYYSQPGDVAERLARILADRVRRGVRVLLLLDGFGSKQLQGDWLHAVRRSGVEVLLFRDLAWYQVDRAASRSHVRAVVIDGRIGYTGGFGIADQWLGDGHHADQWRETNVRFRGPVVAQLQAAFAVAWAEESGELLVGDQFYPRLAVDSAGPVRAGLAFASPTIGSTEAERLLALTIAGARRTLYISNSYFLPDDDFRRFLREAAAGGVDVRVLTASRTQTDVKSVYYASRARYEELLTSGVRMYEYGPAMMHAKTIVVDGAWSAIGSMNFDNRSLALNNESNLLALDAGVGALLDSLFLDDLRHSREVTLASFRKRPFWQRFLERVATLFSRIL